MNTNRINDTTVGLWDILYKVRLPYHYTRSIEDIEKYGTPVTGIKEIDESIDKDMIVTMKCIADLADLYRDGVPIGICNHSDTLKIYQAVQDHIHAWRNYLQVGVNLGASPVDDLVVLDEFANAVHDHAVHQGADKLSNSLIVRQLGFEHTATAKNFFNSEAIEKLLGVNPVSGTVSINSDEKEKPERESLADFFKQVKNSI